MRYLKSSLGVALATALTACAILFGVQLGGAGVVSAARATGVSAATSSGTLTCPATGCTASTCHATSGGHGGFGPGAR